MPKALAADAGLRPQGDDPADRVRGDACWLAGRAPAGWQQLSIFHVQKESA